MLGSGTIDPDDRFDKRSRTIPQASAAPLAPHLIHCFGDPILSHQAPDEPSSREINLKDFQQLIRTMYYEKDEARGIEGTFMWLMEEVGELSSALRDGTQEERLGEFADVLAWLATIANVAKIDLTEAVQRKYGHGCPGCGRLVCDCPDEEKP